MAPSIKNSKGFHNYPGIDEQIIFQIQFHPERLGTDNPTEKKILLH